MPYLIRKKLTQEIIFPAMRVQPNYCYYRKQIF